MASHAQLSNNFHPRIVVVEVERHRPLLAPLVKPCFSLFLPLCPTLDHPRTSTTRRTAHHDKQAQAFETWRKEGRQAGRQDGGRCTVAERTYAGVTLMLKISRWPKQAEPAETVSIVQQAPLPDSYNRPPPAAPPSSRCKLDQLLRCPSSYHHPS